MSDYYQLLGVDREAGSEEIKRAYRRLARQYHPDVNGNDPEAAERFKEISKAYSVLSDPEKRQRYDAYGEAGVEGFAAPVGDPFAGFGASFDDLLGAFFGGGDPFTGRPRTRSRARRGESIGMRLRLPFTEAVFGASKDVRVRAAASCQRCGGSGAKPGTEPTVCLRCNGSGQQRTVRQSLLGQLVTATTCTVCAGSGQEVRSPCPECRGQGLLVQDTTLTIDIPPGLEDGNQIRYPGRGHAGQFGGPPGDLIVELAVDPHPFFERRGDDLVCQVQVPMTVAALGGAVELETLDGPETVEIDPGTQAGT
ncbi:MAG TPA: J domain-containing protein, partial [Actinomycetota bacterium]|nr:J domain-containing protein [Actinomycetota bacterium]